MAPVDRAAIFLGKLLGIVLLMAVVEAIVVVFVALTFGRRSSLPGVSRRVAGHRHHRFATVGTLFAAMLLRTRSRGVLLPILLYPVTFPVLIAGVGGTFALLQSEPNLDLARFWAALLVFFDAVFLTLALWTFEPVMTE